MAVSRPSSMSMFDNIIKNYSEPEEKESETEKKESVTKPETKKEVPKEAPIEVKQEPIKTEPVKETIPEKEKPAEPAKKGKKSVTKKNTPATFYMSPEIIEMIKIASRSYGGNQSLYLRAVITKDFKEHEAAYRAMPNIEEYL